VTPGVLVLRRSDVAPRPIVEDVTQRVQQTASKFRREGNVAVPGVVHNKPESWKGFSAGIAVSQSQEVGEPASLREAQDSLELILLLPASQTLRSSASESPRRGRRRRRPSVALVPPVLPLVFKRYGRVAPNIADAD